MQPVQPPERPVQPAHVRVTVTPWHVHMWAFWGCLVALLVVVAHWRLALVVGVVWAVWTAQGFNVHRRHKALTPGCRWCARTVRRELGDAQRWRENQARWQYQQWQYAEAERLRQSHGAQYRQPQQWQPPSP